MPVVELLRERIDAPSLPLGVDNEANLAALAELWEGAATGISDFVYASGEIGVGGGIVLGGELYRGYRGFGGEFGHTTVEHDGLPVRVRLARLPRDARRPGAAARRRRAERRRRPLARLGQAGRRARPPRAGEGEPTALAALEDCGRWLGVALGTVVNLLSPQAIVLGGHFAPMTEWLAPVIASELATRVLGGNGAVPPVLSSSLGAEAAMRGAAATQLRRVLADPTWSAGSACARRTGTCARGHRSRKGGQASFGQSVAAGDRDASGRRSRSPRELPALTVVVAAVLPPPPERSTSSATQRPLERRTIGLDVARAGAQASKTVTRSKRVRDVTRTRIVPRSESWIRKVRFGAVDGHDRALVLAGLRREAAGALMASAAMAIRKTRVMFMRRSLPGTLPKRRGNRKAKMRLRVVKRSA